MGGVALSIQSMLSAGCPTHLWLSQGQICLEGKECVFYSGCQHLPLWLQPDVDSLSFHLGSGDS